MKNVKFIIIAILLLLIIALNIFLIKSQILGIVFGFFYLIYFSYHLSKSVFKQEQNNGFRFLLGFIFLLGIIILSGTILYYLIGLFNWVVFIVLMIPIVLICLFTISALVQKTTLYCHPDENWNPKFNIQCVCTWIPAFAGMTKRARGMTREASAKALYLLKSKITIEQLNNNNKNLNNKKLSFKFISFSLSQFLLLFSYLLLIIFLFYILFTHQTSDAIVSPWQVLPSYFFIIYFLATFLLLLKILKTQNKNSLTLIIIHSLLTSSVALIIYKIGYGFDPFVHRATEQYILTHGFILPKNPYYIGQYSLVIILSKLFNINFALIDKVLVPVLSSFIIPSITYFTFLKFNLKEKIVQLTSLASTYLILFTIFFTVPQHLANLFLIVFVFLSLLYLNKKFIKLIPLWFIPLSITVIHPLAGFPALLLCWFLTLSLIKNIKIYHASLWCKVKKIVMALSLILALFVMPILFLIASKILQNFEITLNLLNLKNLLSIIPSFTYIPFHSFLHSLYLLKLFSLFFIILAAMIGFYYFYKRFKTTINNVTMWSRLFRDNNITIFPIIIIVLLLNALFLQFLTFKSIIYYEQNIFSGRLIHFAYFFALPFILYAIYLIFNKIIYNIKNIFLSAMGLSFIFCSVFYLVYPRYDILEKNKGFAVSTIDIQTVQLIDQLGRDKNYIVLANQSTSAAALKEFGFKKYYTPLITNYPAKLRSGAGQLLITNLFYYPIPTSSPLYKIYLDITYQGMQNKFIEQAKNLTGTEKVFIVFSDYWTNYKKLWAQGKQTAKNYYNINNKIMIFEF